MTLTKEQHEAVVRLDDNLCVVAGAGTGKTRVLVERFLHLLEVGGCEPSQLAAITFTEKAAAEMLSRLRARCQERMARADDDAQRQLWKRHLEDLGDAVVTTIHGFCRRLLSQHPVEAGLDPHFTVLSDARSSQLMGDSVHRTLREMFEASDPDVLTATQAYSLPTLEQMLRDALLHRDEVRIAAAQSERPLPEQLADLEQFVTSAMTAACDEFLANASLAPLRHMVTSVMGPRGDGREVSREKAAEALAMMAPGQPPEARITGLRDLAGLNLQKHGSAGKWPSPEHHQQMGDALKTLRDSAKDALAACDVAAPELWRRQLEIGEAVARVAMRTIDTYQATKRTLAAVDFDDLLLMARDLLRDHPDVRQRVGGRFRQILVDELQDTDPVQMEIVTLLLTDGAPEIAALRPGSFFGVGDPKQSIYRFRGVDVQVFRHVMDQLGPSHTVMLTRTFRFHQGLADVINTLFAPLLAGDFVPLSAHDTRTPPGCVELLLTDHEDNDHAEARRALEAARIAARIDELVRTGAFRYGDIAILMHRLTQIHTYEEALKRLDIPYYVVSGRRFYEQDEVHDALAALRALMHPHDDLAVAVVLRGPLFGLSDDALYTLCRHKPLTSAIRDSAITATMSPSDAAKVRRAAAWFAHFGPRAGRIGVAQLLQEIMFEGIPSDDGTNACASLAHVLLPQFIGQQRYANLRRLLELARQADLVGGSRIEDFLVEIEAGLREGIREAEAPLDVEGGNSVLIMTVHAAKGLEFPCVILANTDAERRSSTAPLFYADPRLGFAPRRPDRRPNEDEPAAYTLALRQDHNQDDQEFRRLFYVAATRAKDRLILSGARKFARHSWLGMVDGVAALNLAANVSDSPNQPLAHGSPLTVNLASAPAMGSRRVSAELGPLAKAFHEGEVNDAELDRLLARSADATLTGRLAARCSRVAEGGATIHLTATSLTDYAVCPARYYLRHVLGLDEHVAAPASDDAERLNAAAIGTVVHAYLERADDPTQPANEDVIRQWVLRESRLRADQREEAVAAARRHLDAFRHTALAGEIAAAAKRNGRLFRELRFSMTHAVSRICSAVGDVVISGTIDLLFMDSRGEWVVVDYKTDAIAPEDARERTIHYLPQLQVYRMAAKKFLKINAVRTCLAFLGAGIVEDIEDISVHTVVDRLAAGIASQAFKPGDTCSDSCVYVPFCRMSS